MPSAVQHQEPIAQKVQTTHVAPQLQSIDVMNEQGRLSQTEIDRMFQEAEWCRDNDEVSRVKIEVKTALELLRFCIEHPH